MRGLGKSSRKLCPNVPAPVELGAAWTGAESDGEVVVGDAEAEAMGDAVVGPTAGSKAPPAPDARACLCDHIMMMREEITSPIKCRRSVTLGAYTRFMRGRT